MFKILVVDDDPKLQKMVRRTLIYEGYTVATANNGREALNALQTDMPDLIVLDWLMPEVDGLEVVRRLRTAGDEVLVLMLTAKDAVSDLVEGLDGGADDYLVKPFDPQALLARIRALLRRLQNTPSTDKAITFADLHLDSTTRETRRGQRRFNLTPKEFDLLHYLMRHPRQVLLREQILEEVWGYDFGGDDNVLEVYIGYLRKKTEAGSETRLIQTIRGVGYVIRED